MVGLFSISGTLSAGVGRAGRGKNRTRGKRCNSKLFLLFWRLFVVFWCGLGWFCYVLVWFGLVWFGLVLVGLGWVGLGFVLFRLV